MEASQFTQGEELEASDPFGESGMGDFEQGEDPFEEQDAPVTAEPVPGLPVVDAEGKKVTNEETQAAPEPVADEPVAEPDPTLAPPSPGGFTELGDDEEAREQEQRKAQSEALPRAEVGSDGQKVAAPKKAEAKEKSHAAVRGYYLLVPEGDGKFAQLEWYEDKDGNATTKEKGKKTKVANVAGKREALAIGFAALGEPVAGAKLVAAPVSYFEIKTVKGKDDPPPRRRPVSIS